MSEKPLDRLNYFNGQRLEASDLKLEQQYHIRVRRWLNKSLYTTGIAQGLDVAPDLGNPLNVIVSPGLALDSAGHEIILLDQVSIPAIGTPSATPGIVDGNYLTIQYNEQVTEFEQDGCIVQVEKKSGCGCGNGKNHAASAKNKLPWGGPAFLRAAPILGFTNYLPSDTSGKIILGQIELDNNCNVVSVHAEVRRYVGAASAAKVFQYALEGEREIASGTDSNTETSATIYFHVRGRQPNAVTLYLRAEQFSTLHYTEMGEHTHSASISGTTGSASPPLTKNDTTHVHDAGTLVASAGTNADHNHDLMAREGYLGSSSVPTVAGNNNEGKGKGLAAFFVIEKDWSIIYQSVAPLPYSPEQDTTIISILPDVNGSISGGGQHTHTVTGQTAANPGFAYDHTHTLSGSGSTGISGVTDPAFPPGGVYSARSGAPLAYINELQVLIDGVPQTDNILTQLTDSDQTGYVWSQLGDGTQNHALAANGSGPIKLDFLPLVRFTEGEHRIEIHSLPKKDSNGNRTILTGGRILYNLYVE
jgi:hypothetical protein